MSALFGVPLIMIAWFIGGLTGFIIGSCDSRKAARVGIIWMGAVAVMLVIATYGQPWPIK